MAKNVIFQIDGGIGKCVAATAVCKAVRKKYPNDNLIVISGYPDVFLNNPYVTKSLQTGNLAYFYTDNIEGKDIKLMLHNPYLEANYVNESQHLIKTWCEMFEIEYDGELPELFLNQREIDFYQSKYQSDKPIFLMQTNGGANTDLKYSFARDLPFSVVSQVIQAFLPTHNIVHVRREDQIGYQNTNVVSAGFREILALAMLSDKIFLIDSFLQHSCAALGLSATVCWITNNPKVLGYELHDNILANPHTRVPELRQSYISKFNIGGDPLEFPYNNEAEIFDANKIIASLRGDSISIEPVQLLEPVQQDDTTFEEVTA
jgi:hypothetical protein